MWAKISTSATAMACAACLATAATLPAMGTAGEQLAKQFSSAEVNLAVDFSRLAAFDAIPAYIALLGGDLTALDDLDSLSAVNPILALLGGDITALDDLDSTSAINPYIALLGGDLTALDDLDSVSAINPYIALAGGDLTALDDLDSTSAINPYIRLAGGDLTALDDLDSTSAINPYIALAGGDITATGDLDSLSAVDTFFGDGPVGAGGVFTGGGLAALEPDADGNGGYAALSAIPALLDIPPQVPVPVAPVTTAAAPEQDLTTTSTLFSGRAALPQAQPAPEAVPQVDPTVTTPDNSGAANQNITRNSKKFEPIKLGDSPLLFGSGTQGGEGMRGYGSFLKKLGIGGADATSDGAADGAE